MFIQEILTHMGALRKTLKPLCLLMSLSCLVFAQDLNITEEVIIFVKKKKEEQIKPQVALPDQEASGRFVPKNKDDIYSVVWNHPDQIFVDSDIGPMPLYTEVVFDEHGNPRPRFPDVFTKKLMDDPNAATATAYLASNRARWHRYNQASAVMRKTAADIGYVSASNFESPPDEPLRNARRTYHQPQEGWGKKEYGAPVMDEEQARYSGIKPEDIPYTPGIATSMYVEVLYIWDWKCKYSNQGLLNFSKLGKELNEKEMGVRFLTISVDNDPVKANAQLDYVDYLSRTEGDLNTNGKVKERLGVTKFIENWIDVTDTIKSFNVKMTPTYLVINRMSGKMLRLEGLHTEKEIKSAIMESIGKNIADWDKMDPRWFRKAERAFGYRKDYIADVDTSGKDASPIQNPTKIAAPWSPEEGRIIPLEEPVWQDKK